jgi:hypothetical protein
MSQTDILNQVGEGLKWLVIGGGCAMGYYYTLCGLQFLNAISPFNVKIKSQEHLEGVIKEEAPKIGLDSSKIYAKYNRMGDTSVEKRGEGHILFMDEGIGCTRGSVKHELWHIKKGDCERKKDKGVHYYLVREPRAVLYQVFGWKI